MAYPADEGDLVAFELHTGTAPVSQASAGECVGDLVGGGPHIRGQSLEHGGQGKPVRLMRR